MAATRSPIVGLRLPLATAILLASVGIAAQGAVRGIVRNATTGGPAANVTLTLSSFRGGMTPVGETVSAADGSFAFDKELPAVSAGQPFAGAIRAEHDGIGYTEILRSDTELDDVTIIVYSAIDGDLIRPTNRVVILEPGEGRMLVRESFQFLNDSEPPVTYSSADGTLRFHLPEAAGGDVQVSGTGPAGMPLRSTALPTPESEIYKVDFPIKPGENRIDLSYSIPHRDGTQFTLRSVYPEVATRVAAPEGVQISGENVQSLGNEPTTNAAIYAVPEASAVTLAVSGRGALNTEGPSGGAGAQISVEPAPIARELPWLAGLAILILGLGFAHHLAARPSEANAQRTRKEG